MNFVFCQHLLHPPTANLLLKNELFLGTRTEAFRAKVHPPKPPFFFSEPMQNFLHTIVLFTRNYFGGGG